MGNNRLIGLSRRGLLTGLAATSAAASLPAYGQRYGKVASAGLLGPASKLHHLSVGVSDLKKSAMFYQTLFGFPPIRYLPPPGSETYGWNFNGHLLSLTRVKDKSKAGKISHYCIAVDNLDVDRDGEKLKKNGLKNVMIDHKGEDNWIVVPDLDGVPIQILDSTYDAPCTMCGPVPDNAAQDTPKNTIWKATRIDHVGITSSNIENARVFYQNLFGFEQPRPLAAGEMGFDFNGHLLSIAEVPKAEAGKITHFSVAVDNFDAAKDRARLEAVGIKANKGVDEQKNGLTLRDPDGTLVQVNDTNFHWPCPGCEYKRVVKFAPPKGD